MAVHELIENIENMLRAIEEKEIVEPNYGVVRELAEQLREELLILQG